MGVGCFDLTNWNCGLKFTTAFAGWTKWCFWAVSNVVNDQKYWEDNNSGAISLSQESWDPERFRLMDHENGDSDDSDDPDDATPYWFTSNRPTSTTFQIIIYTDEAKTNVFDTIAITIPETLYRYWFAVASYNSGSGSQAGGVVEDFYCSLAEAGGGSLLSLLMEHH